MRVTIFRILRTVAFVLSGLLLFNVFRKYNKYQWSASATRTANHTIIGLSSHTRSRRSEHINSSTRKRNTTLLDDIFISVKTSGSLHKSRLRILLDTWVQQAKKQTVFFTDIDDNDLVARTGVNLVNTNCSSTHSRQALCCKMSVEFDHFIASGKKWFCHLDDDNYLNVPQLLRLLGRYDPSRDWYLGKPSINHPLEITNPHSRERKLSFWFATGGAGFCVSRALARRMEPTAGGGRLRSQCDFIRLPDDCTLGYIISRLLKVRLTVVKEFHSHLEALWLIKRHQIASQLTFSHSVNKKRKNVVLLPGLSHSADPSRFLSIHCFLYPETKYCPRASKV